MNDQLKQLGNVRDMIWPVADAISHILRFMTLAPGDLIFSGTPAGVAALQPADRVPRGVDGVAEFDFQIGPAPAAGRT